MSAVAAVPRPPSVERRPGLAGVIALPAVWLGVVFGSVLWPAYCGFIRGFAFWAAAGHPEHLDRSWVPLAITGCLAALAAFLVPLVITAGYGLRGRMFVNGVITTVLAGLLGAADVHSLQPWA
jgi:hypothetical protein